jgi:ABC-2 type transport system ATP-binding protein
VIEARELTKRHAGNVVALDDVSFDVDAGEVYCLLGPAGSGKTTLINLFWNADSPTRGQSLIAGHDVRVHPGAAGRAGTVITSDAALFGALSARRNVQFFVRMAGCRANRSALEHAMRLMGVRDRDFDQPLSRLDAAVAKLLWLAVAAARDSPAVLLDDPTSSISARGSGAIQEGIRQLRDQGKSVLVATSDLAFATAVGDRIGVLKAGRKVSERTRGEILGQSLPTFYLEYFGRQARGPNGHSAADL